MAASREERNQRGNCDAGPMQPIENETARGLRFAHMVTASIEQQNRETRANAGLLAQLLIARGVIGEEEWTGQLERARGVDTASA